MAIEIRQDIPVSKDLAAGPDKAKRKWLSLSGDALTTADRILFTERLSLQLATGVTLYTALQVLQQQTDKPAMRKMIGDLLETIVEGGKFSDGLARHPKLFSKSYVSLVAASETGGFLPRVLDQLVEMDEKAERLRSTVVSSLSYPAFLLFFSVAVTVFILVAVFPKFSSMFQPIYASLPGTTKILMAASDMLTRNPLQIVIPLAAGVALIVLVLRLPAGKRWLDGVKLRAPLLRDIVIKIYLIRLMRTLGISLERGVNVLTALGACREVVPNFLFQEFMQRLEKEVREGKGIAAGFNNESFIPSSVAQMIATGEESGKLGHVMARIADFYDRELTKQLNYLAKLSEPVMLLVMGGVVGIIVSALILPIFKLSRAAG